jgi:signal transduction histidine kinase
VRLSKANLVVLTAAALVFALLSVFATELSNTQDRSKTEIEAQVNQRAVLAAALINSLLQLVRESVPQDVSTYGARTISDQTMDAVEGKMGGYVVVLDWSGRALASSSGFTSEARAGLAHSGALALVRSGRPFALGDLSPYGETGVVDLDVAFRTPFGPRILVDGFIPKVLSDFVAGELEQIPGVKGARNYLVDGNDVVLASTNPLVPVGRALAQPGAAAALRHRSADLDGSFFDQAALTNSDWRILLVAPNGPLFASVSGLHEWLPWVIFVAFAVVAVLALALGLRLLRSREQLQSANGRLKLVNAKLTSANGELESRANELARSNEELDQFASIASHDLQEPLRKVRAFANELVETEGERLSPKGREYLQKVNDAGERMQRLVEDLLRLSRVATQRHPFAPVDLDQLASEVLSDFDAQIESSGAIVRVGHLPTIEADPLQLRQLVQNLVSNALKFRRPGAQPELTIAAIVINDEVELTVRDNGIGFDPRYSERIFKIFERLHGRGTYPGTGIGLAMCRKIVERHGGSIVAAGKPDEGAVFTVKLPLHQREAVTVLPERAGQFDHEPKGVHVHA